MKYWLSVHWPPTVDDAQIHNGLWLHEETEEAGKDLRPGDLVFIYETKWGRPREDRLGYWLGRQGIVALFEVVELDLEKGFAWSPEVYTDGNKILWKMVARTRPIETKRFCSHDNVCDCLQYSRNYFFRGFGKFHSGLLELTGTEFGCLRNRFK